MREKIGPSRLQRKRTFEPCKKRVRSVCERSRKKQGFLGKKKPAQPAASLKYRKSFFSQEKKVRRKGGSAQGRRNSLVEQRRDEE